MNMTPFICAGCQEPIMERFLMKVLDKSWHVSCVKCTGCQCSLSEKCFSRENKLYCRADFFKRFGTPCAACNMGLCPEDLVRRAVNKVYHIQCFTCSICKRQLNTGEQLYLVQGGEKFLCESCYPAPAPVGVQTLGSGNAVPAGKTSSRKISEADQQLPLTPIPPVAATSAISQPQVTSSDSKKGKTRTSINPRQLEVLQATYEKDPKPSRSVREEIASQTGLTMKVIQVWFQNRRSKDKKDGLVKEEALPSPVTPGHLLGGPTLPSLPENGVAMLQQNIHKPAQ